MELLSLSESPNSNTNFPRYSSSSSDRFAASIWSLRIKKGFRNQSKNASFGRFFEVISVTPSPTQMPRTKQFVNPKMLKETVCLFLDNIQMDTRKCGYGIGEKLFETLQHTE